MHPGSDILRQENTWNLFFLGYRFHYQQQRWKDLGWQCYHWGVLEFSLQNQIEGCIAFCSHFLHNQQTVHLQFHSQAQIGDSFHGTILSNPCTYWQWIHSSFSYQENQLVFFWVVASFDECLVSTIPIWINVHNWTSLFVDPIPCCIFKPFLKSIKTMDHPNPQKLMLVL